MKTYLTLFLSSALWSLLLTPLVLKLSKRFNIGQDGVGGRKIHSRPIPRLGGIVIYISVLFTLSLLFLYDNHVTIVFQVNLRDITFILAPASLMFLVGFYDDLRGLNPWTKLGWQVGAALLIYVMGLRIQVISNPLTGDPLALGWLALPVTVFWLVGVTNAFNMIDGMDGLAGGLACLISLSVCLMGVLNRHVLISIFAVTLLGATLGFLRFNFHPARIFMGDGGSHFLGFLLAALAIRTTQKSSVIVSIAIPLLILGVPILETMVTVLRRLLAGKPLFQADGGHIHHMLLESGKSQRVIVLLMYMVTAAFGLTAFILVFNRTMGVAIITLLVAVVLTLIFTRLGYHEFHELRDLLGRAVFFQRRILRNQIYIRQVANNLEKSSGLRELFAQLSSTFERLGFAQAQVQVTVACENPGWRTHMYRWVPEERLKVSGQDRNSSSQEMWTMTIPLVNHQTMRAQMTLMRSVKSTRLYFEIYSLVDLFGGKLGKALQRFSEVEYRDFFESNGRQRAPDVEAGESALAPLPAFTFSGATRFLTYSRGPIRSASRTPYTARTIPPREP